MSRVGPAPFFVLAAVLAAGAFLMAAKSCSPAPPAASVAPLDPGLGADSPVPPTDPPGQPDATSTTVAVTTTRVSAVSPATSGPSPTRPPGEPAPDRSDPTVVAVAALKTVWTVDTAVDGGPRDANLRASAFYTPAYAAGLAGVPRPQSAGAVWAEWSAHKAVTTVDVAANHDAGAPADSPSVAYRQYVVTVTPAGRDGWTGAKETHVEFVTLTFADGGWSISNIETT